MSHARHYLKNWARLLRQTDEKRFVAWILKFYDLCHLLSLVPCRLQVAEITQDKNVFLTKGIPCPQWVVWLKARNHELTLRVGHGL